MPAWNMLLSWERECTFSCFYLLNLNLEIRMWLATSSIVFFHIFLSTLYFDYSFVWFLLSLGVLRIILCLDVYAQNLAEAQCFTLKLIINFFNRMMVRRKFMQFRLMLDRFVLNNQAWFFALLVWGWHILTFFTKKISWPQPFLSPYSVILNLLFINCQIFFNALCFNALFQVNSS